MSTREGTTEWCSNCMLQTQHSINMQYCLNSRFSEYLSSLNNRMFKWNSKKYLYLFRFQWEVCRAIILSWPANLILGLTSVQLTFQGLYFLQALTVFTYETGVIVQIIYSSFQRGLDFEKGLKYMGALRNTMTSYLVEIAQLTIFLGSCSPERNLHFVPQNHTI